MGRLARLRAEEYIIYRVEQQLQGKPICTCHRNWFPRHSRYRARMMKQEDLVREGLSHQKECEMVSWFEEGGPET
jgi:hypothetical protein